jgi:hypothetical protein
LFFVAQGAAASAQPRGFLARDGQRLGQDCFIDAIGQLTLLFVSRVENQVTLLIVPKMSEGQIQSWRLQDGVTSGCRTRRNLNPPKRTPHETAQRRP